MRNRRRLLREQIHEQLRADIVGCRLAARRGDPRRRTGPAFRRNARMRDHLTDLIDLIDQMERVVLVSVANVKTGDPQSLVREHRELIDALQARQTRRAEHHIAAAGKRVSRAISRMVVPGQPNSRTRRERFPHVRTTAGIWRGCGAVCFQHFERA